MRILRLTNSNDFTSDVAETDRGYHLVADALHEASGEEVETIVKIIWPSDDLPEIVERWVNQFQPDIVFLKINNFWYSYESVPLRLRRKFGTLGRAAGDAGLKAADRRWVAHNRVFRRLRSFAQATIGGDTHFSIDYVMANMEAVMRRILRNEEVMLVVRASRGGSERPDLPRKVEARRHARRLDAQARIKALCEQLNVPVIRGNSMRKFEPAKRTRDMFHSNAHGHRDGGEFEAEGLVRIWNELHPERTTGRSIS